MSTSGKTYTISLSQSAQIFCPGGKLDCGVVGRGFVSGAETDLNPDNAGEVGDTPPLCTLGSANHFRFSMTTLQLLHQRKHYPKSQRNQLTWFWSFWLFVSFLHHLEDLAVLGVVIFFVFLEIYTVEKMINFFSFQAEVGVWSTYPKTPPAKTSACAESVSAIVSSLYIPTGLLYCLLTMDLMCPSLEPLSCELNSPSKNVSGESGEINRFPLSN